jgi:hypothetical protein
MTQPTDLALLRRFEPIIHYTRGEQFFPIDVARYVDTCNLWVKRPNDSQAECLVPSQILTLDTLAEPRLDRFGSVYYLRFADPLTAGELASYKLQNIAHKDPEHEFHTGGGRLARVGYPSRLVHALFQLSLLARGRVPGDAAAAASITYSAIQSQQETYSYCGRIIRENGWIVLQYWFLYAFNNWRSGYYGMNDHEADWEMVAVYLSESSEGQPARGDVTPEWVAYASHDFSGDDLRRCWDDLELEKVGEHPVVYAAAGSHASYYQAGEYLVEVEVPAFTPVRRVFEMVQTFLQQKLRQFTDEAQHAEEPQTVNMFRLPFVDYARGDGLTIGPGQEKCWASPYLITSSLPWVSQYRGLWGRFISDPLAGENAPAGPMYNRDGSVRRAWYDPIGWAGLDKVPPRNQAPRLVQNQYADLAVRQAELLEKIEEKSDQLTGLGVQVAALRHQPHLEEIFKGHQERLKILAEEIDQLRAELAKNRALQEAFELYADRLQHGEFDPPRTHIRRAATPIPESDLQVGRLMEIWAAVSIGLMLISLVGLIFLAPQVWFVGIISIVLLFIVIESTFRRSLDRLVTRVTYSLALFAALVLVIDYFPHLLVLIALVTGGYMMWENLRELWS